MPANNSGQLKIWGRKNSVNVQKVLWCLSELDLDYERIDAGMALIVGCSLYLVLTEKRRKAE